jgi:hypothetical protein
VSPAPNADVDLAVDLRLVVPDDEAVPLPVGLRYTSSDPFAVTVAFRGDDISVEWVFARDLLLDGLLGPCGHGDVHVWPGNRSGRELVFISLSSPDGHAVLEADRADVTAFLTRASEVVAPGDEHRFIDLDAEIATLLA